MGGGAPFSTITGLGQSAGASSFAQQRAASDLGSFAARGGGADLATTRNCRRNYENSMRQRLVKERHKCIITKSKR